MKLPHYAGSGEGSDHLGSIYAAFPCKFLQEAVSMTSHEAAAFTTAPRLPFKFLLSNGEINYLFILN
jgi:hypothetical protein